jgi:hypothetical protein
LNEVEAHEVKKNLKPVKYVKEKKKRKRKEKNPTSNPEYSEIKNKQEEA